MFHWNKDNEGNKDNSNCCHNDKTAIQFTILIKFIHNIVVVFVAYDISFSPDTSFVLS